MTAPGTSLATALYEPNDKSMAEADEAGLVKILDIPGNVAVMVRYQGMVSVYSASIPLGAKVENLPAAKNFIDRARICQPEADRHSPLAGLR